MTLEQAISGIEKLTQKAAEKGKQFMEEAIVANGNVETYHMLESVNAHVYSMWAADVTVDTPYAHWVDDGRGPVTPVRKKTLHWISPKTGEVFAKYAGPYGGSHFSKQAADRLASYEFTL